MARVPSTLVLFHVIQSCTCICSDIDKIHDGIGDKLAILVQWVVTFFAGFIIGFVRDWRLTLFLLGAVTPFLVVSAAAFSKVSCIT